MTIFINDVCFHSTTALLINKGYKHTVSIVYSILGIKLHCKVELGMHHDWDLLGTLYKCEFFNLT